MRRLCLDEFVRLVADDEAAYRRGVDKGSIKVVFNESQGVDAISQCDGRFVMEYAGGKKTP